MELLPVQEPIDGQNKSDVVSGKTNCVQNHDHGHKTGLRDTGGPDGSGRGRDTDGDDLSDAETHVPDLRDEDGGHGLVQSGAVHVDGGANWQNKPEKKRNKSS